MQFLKKHYEKILLGAVLLGLAGAVVFLYFKVESEKEADASQSTTLTNPKPTVLPQADTSPVVASIKRRSTVASLDLGPPHKLFNPMPWEKGPEHLEPFTSTNVGPMALVVTKLNPLNLELTLDSLTVEDKTVSCLVSVKKDAAPLARDRGKHQTSCKAGDKRDIFTVKGFGGPAEAPTNVVLELNDTGEEIQISKDQPYRRVEGYTADLKYPPDKAWSGRRVGTSIPLGLNNEEYKIVAINPAEIVLSAKSNDKKWSIPVK